MHAPSTPQSPVRRAAAACLLAVAVALLAPATPARAWTDGACPDADSGVTVVVDFHGFRDEVVVRCAPAPVESGYAALRKVGLEPTGTQRFPGMLCRIDGVPADAACGNAPPADAYWAYFRAEPGGTWQYSQHGPATTSPPPGPVEGWRFSHGDEHPPRVAPPGAPARAPSPTPTPTPTRTATPTPTPTSAPPPPAATTPPPPPPATSAPPDTSAPPPAPEATGSSPAPTEPAPTEPSPTPTSDPTPTTEVTTSPPAPTPTGSPASEDALAPAAAPADDGDGPPIATLVGVVLVAAVGGGAWVTNRRRRRA